MERLYPKGDEIPIFQFYMAQNIQDMLSSRGETVDYSLHRFLEWHKETGELSFMVHSDNLFNRAWYMLFLISAPYLPDILVDRNKNYTLYRITGSYIYLPRVRHIKDYDKEEKGNIVLHDDSGEVTVCFPNRFLFRGLEERGWLEKKALKQNDWQSGVILQCDYGSGGDRYKLVQVFNKWAMEHQKETIQQFVGQYVPKTTS